MKAILFVFPFVLAVAYFPISQCQNLPLIEHTCKQTPYYGLCVTSLKSDPRSKTAGDVQAIALIMVDIIKAKAGGALQHIEKLKQKYPALRVPLSACKDRFNAIIIGDVPQAVEALTKGDPKFAVDAANDAALEADSFIVPVIIQCDDNLINQICRRTPFRDLCIATLEPNTNSSSSDVKGLASIMANIVLGNASDTLNYIEGLIKQAPDPQQERALANCAELYIPVVRYELPQAIDALSKGHFGFANYCIADAGKQADACEKGFSGSAKSPLSDRNNLLKSLCGIAVAIINLLAKGLS
ncbi:hypothetical protein WN943_028347 [Citrus x changshan-huyou]